MNGHAQRGEVDRSTLRAAQASTTFRRGSFVTGCSSVLEVLQRFVEAVRYPGFLSKLCLEEPRSLTSWLIAHRLGSIDAEFRTIIDGGANVGQFAKAIHQCFPQASIISFEPLPDMVVRLRTNLKDLENCVVVNAALGAEDGSTEFHRHRYSQSSSVRRLLPNANGVLASGPEIELVTVPAITLDSALEAMELTPPCLLKLDLQGYELEALKGGRHTLRACSHLLIETSFFRQYIDEPLFEDVSNYLSAIGFRFDGPLNVTRNQYGRIVQMDALFSRASA